MPVKRFSYLEIILRSVAVSEYPVLASISEELLAGVAKKIILRLLRGSVSLIVAKIHGIRVLYGRIAEKAECTCRDKMAFA
jgi:hypothetical protein